MATRAPARKKAVTTARATRQEQASRQQASRQQASRQQASWEQASRQQASRQQASREQASRQQASRQQDSRQQADKCAMHAAARVAVTMLTAAAAARVNTKRESTHTSAAVASSSTIHITASKKASIPTNAKEIHGMKSKLNDVGKIVKIKREEPKEMTKNKMAVELKVEGGRQHGATRQQGQQASPRDRSSQVQPKATRDISDDDSCVNINTSVDINSPVFQKQQDRSRSRHVSADRFACTSTAGEDHRSTGHFDFPASSDDSEDNEDVRIHVAKLLAGNIGPSTSATPDKGMNDTYKSLHDPIMTSPQPVNHGLLRSVEFWPNAVRVEKSAKDSIFETFSAVMARANQWLCEHHSYRLLNCETAEKKVTRTDQIYGDQMHYLGSTSPCILIKGLRLWLTEGEQCFDELHLLKHVDVVPRKLETDTGLPKYATIDAALDRYNAILKKKPLPGSVVTVETVGLTISRHKWNGTINTDDCQWTDRMQRDRFYFLRVFYITGPTAHENIGLADFIPNQLSGTGMVSGRPKFELFEGVLEQASEWISAAKEVRITNVQTVETKYCKYKEHEGLKVNTMASYEPKVEMRPRVFFLRVCYVRCFQIPGVHVTMPPPPNLSSRTFRPNIIRDQSCCGMIRLQFEGVTETTSLISEWAAKTGVKPFCAHLLAVPQWYMERGDFNERMVYNGEYCKEDGTCARLSLMYLLRVYVDGKTDGGPDYFDLPYESFGCTVL